MPYYQETLGVKILAAVEYGAMVDPENSGQLPKTQHHHLLSGALDIDGKSLLFSDEFPSEGQPDYNDVSVSIMSSDFDQSQGCFYNLVKESTEVIVLFQAIDWFLGYSMLRDK